MGQTFICSNPSCGKTFTSPIKAQNLASKTREPYDACPYCLTEILLDENPAVMEETRKSERKEIEVEEPTRLDYNEEKSTLSKPQSGCAHYFGYLSERSAKGKIPDECMICGKIVQCMLKNVTS